MAYVLFRYLHLIAILVLAGGIVIENIAIRSRISEEDIRNLARVDAVCGMAVLAAIGFGIVLWFGVGKPAAFYNENPVFFTKLALLALLLLLAAKPALFFIRNRNFESKENEELAVPRAVIVCLKLELLLVLIIPVLAWLMARGVGISP